MGLAHRQKPDQNFQGAERLVSTPISSDLLGGRPTATPLD
jgi:hypothetical protein